MNSTNLIIAILLICIFLFGVFKIHDPDIWFYLASGRHLLQTHQIIKHDIFSYTSEGKPWPNTTWLTQIIFYGIYAIGSFNALILFKAFLMAAVFSLVLISMHRRKSAFPISVLIILLAAVIARHRFTIRPHLFTFLFVAFYSYLLYRFSCEEREPVHLPGKSVDFSKLIWILLPLQLIWANLHSGNPFGLTLVSIYFISGLLEAGYDKLFLKKPMDEVRKRRLKILFALTAGIFLISLMNPSGWRSLTYGYFTIKEKILRTYVVEFRSTDFFKEALSFRLYFFLGLASLALNRSRRLSDILTFAVFFTLSICVVRFKPEFVIASSPAIAEGLSNSLERFFNKEELAAWRGGLRRRLAHLALVVIITCVTWEVVRERKAWMVFGLGINDAAYPKKAVEFVKREDVKGKMFNPMAFGHYIIWHLYPERKVFIDGRTDVYDPELLYKNVYFNEPEIWDELTEKYNFDYAILSNMDIIRRYPCKNLDSQRDKWALVLWDDTSILYLKRTAQNEDLIGKYEYRYVFPNNPDMSYLDAYLKNPGDKEKVIEEFERNLKENPSCLLTHTSLAYIHTLDNQDEKAIEHLEKAIEITPYRAELYGRLGAIYQRKNMTHFALAQYKKALRLDPKNVSARINLGGMYFLKGEYRKALYHYHRALKIEPGNEAIKQNALLATEAMKQ